MSDTLYREVDVPCDPDVAWEFVTDPAWLGDGGEIDLATDGEGWVQDGDETRYLVVEEIEEARHFSYRWATFNDAPSRVQIDLEPINAGTRISIIESPLQARAMLLAA